MIKYPLAKFLTPLLIYALAVPAFPQTPPNPIKVLSYYSGPAAGLDSVEVSQMTDIIFCFGRPDGNRFKMRRAQDTLTL